MIIPSSDFRHELFEGNRNYIISAFLYTSNGTYQITNAQIWQNTFSVEDMISQDDTFDVGTAIINKFTIGLNNIYEQYSGINFKNGVIIPRVGLLVNGEAETHQKGIFIIDDCKYDGSIIKLSCLDLMEVFDREYSTDLSYPATLRQIVDDACDKCGITINNVKYPLVPDEFVNENYSVSEAPSKEGLSFREVLSWCAQIASGFARVDRFGKLEIKWFDTDALSGLSKGLDGGYFDGSTTPSIPSEYLNTTDGMTQLITNSRHDDDRFEIDGADWFVINGSTCPKLYVCGNSWISPDYNGATAAFPSSAGVAWAYNCRNGAMWNLWRQEFTVDGKRVLKIRWDGSSSYSSGSYTENYKAIWELFLMEGGYSFIHLCKKPSYNYNGENKVKVGGVTTNYTPVAGKTYAFAPDGSEIIVQPYESGDTADGGGFMTGGDTYDGGTFTENKNIHYITECFATDVAVDETTVTGVKLTYQIKKDDGNTETKTITSGTMDFKVTVTDNDFIRTDEQATLVCATVADTIIGMKFYRADITHLSDPCIEAGDIAMVRNFRGNFYPILISRTKFGISVSQVTNSNAETDSKNTSYRDMPNININTDIPVIDIPTDLLVITDPNGEDWAIYIDPTGVISTVKVPKRIYYYANPVTEYFPGDTVDVSTAVVHAVYNDGTEIDVTAECTFSPAQGVTVPEGDFTITATWVFTPGVTNNGGN